MIHTLRPLIVRFAAAAFILAGVAASFGAPSFAQDGGGYAGNNRDSVTGYPCVTPQCDTISLPGTDCLCQKNNPNEERLSMLSLTCTSGMGANRQQCPVQPKYGN